MFEFDIRPVGRSEDTEVRQWAEKHISRHVKIYEWTDGKFICEAEILGWKDGIRVHQFDREPAEDTYYAGKFDLIPLMDCGNCGKPITHEHIDYLCSDCRAKL